MTLVRSTSTLVAAAIALTGALAATHVYAAPTPLESVDVVLHEDPAGSVLIVSGTLPASTPLPAEMRLSLPAGMQLQWAGEILGGPAEQDPSLQPVLTAGDGFDVYTLTVSQSRIAQIEAAGDAALGIDGEAVRVSLAWPAPDDVAQVNIGARVPQGAKITVPAEGAQLVPGPTGYDYYRRTVTGVKAGESVELSFAFVPPAGAPVQSGTTAGGPMATNPGSTGGWLPIALALVGAAALAVAVARKIGARSAPVGAPVAPVTPAPVAAPLADSADDEVLSVDAAVHRSADPGLAGASTARRNRNLVLAAVAFAVAAGIFFAVRGVGEPQYAGDSATMTFAPGEACDALTVGLGLESGDGTADRAEGIFESLSTIPGIVSATIDFRNPSVTIGYCASESSPEALMAALDAAGAEPIANTQPAAPAPSVPATQTP